MMIKCENCRALVRKRARRCHGCGAEVKALEAPIGASAVPDLCDDRLSEKLRPLNEKKRRFWTIGSLLFIPAGVVAFAAFRLGMGFGLLMGCGALMIVGLIFYVRSICPLLDMRALISTHVVQGMLEDNFELIEYRPKEFISTAKVRSSYLPWSVTGGTDFFRAKYRGVFFEFSDVWLYSERLGRKAQWLILGLHREIPTPLMISGWEPRGEHFSKQARQERVSGNRIRYAVFTESPDLLPHVLTPAFQEFLFKPHNSLLYTPSKHIFFKEAHAHFGIGIGARGRDFFEPCRNVQDIPAFRERVQEEIDCIKNIIDGFLLIEWLFPGAETDGRL